MPLKALLFDFDGVILDSLEVKTQAFYNMYLPYGKEIAQKVADHHLANGGVSRFEKFRIYHREQLGQEITDEKVNQLANEFSQKVLEEVINSAEVKGIREFLAEACKTYKMWVITGTPTPEIHQIAKATGFDKYFVELYGSPEKKDFWTKKILTEEGFNPKEVVFIGDATADYEAALKNEVGFVLREHADNLDVFKDKELIRIQDFTDFEGVLTRHFNS